MFLREHLFRGGTFHCGKDIRYKNHLDICLPAGGIKVVSHVATSLTRAIASFTPLLIPVQKCLIEE